MPGQAANLALARSARLPPPPLPTTAVAGGLNGPDDTADTTLVGDEYE